MIEIYSFTSLIGKIWFDQEKREKSKSKWYFPLLQEIEDLPSFLKGVDFVKKNV
jgi:hypothetical protein